MKNIMLAVEVEVVAAIRKYAAAHNTTVNGLVRDYLARLAKLQDLAGRALQEPGPPVNRVIRLSR